MKTDVLIIGGGPGGSAMAMFLAREGIKPVILEQEEFPRFHIGESMTGEAAQVVRRLGLEQQMVKHPVKHGVKVFGTTGVNSWYVPVSSRDKEWNLSFSTTWQVRRNPDEFRGQRRNKHHPKNKSQHSLTRVRTLAQANLAALV